MNSLEQQKLAHFETFFFWHRGRRELFAELLSKFLPTGKKKILDYGCGPGGNIVFLKEFGAVSGVDVSDEALRLASTKGFARLDHIEDVHTPYERASFDVIVCLDVLEHIPNDAEAVLELYRLLRPGGTLLVSVPAYQRLWNEHDEALGHVRRYGRKQLEALLEGPFTIRYRTFFCVFGAPAQFGSKLLKQFFPAKSREKRTYESEYPIGKFGNAFLYSLLRVERFFSRCITLPFGSSLVVVATKK